jgi:hypothetical protein
MAYYLPVSPTKSISSSEKGLGREGEREETGRKGERG